MSSTTMQLKGVIGAGAAVATSASGAARGDDGFGDELDRLEQELLGEFDRDEEDDVPSVVVELLGEVGTADEVVGVVVAKTVDVGKVAEEKIFCDSPRRRADTAAAQADAAKARAEKKKLWEAAEAMMSDQKAVVELRYRDALVTARAEAEFEKQRVAESWDMIRDICDMNVFAAITRQVHNGCNGERALSIGVARRLFEGPATMTTEPKTPSSISRDVRSQTPKSGATDSQRLASFSQSRGMRLRRDASRDSAATPMVAEGASTGYPAKPPRSSSRTSIAMPPRPPQQQQQSNSASTFELEQQRSARKSVPVLPTWPFTKQGGDATPQAEKKMTEENKENRCVLAFDSPRPTGAHGKTSGLRQDSPSVRDRVSALEDLSYN